MVVNKNFEIFQLSGRNQYLYNQILCKSMLFFSDTWKIKENIPTHGYIVKVWGELSNFSKIRHVFQTFIRMIIQVFYANILFSYNWLKCTAKSACHKKLFSLLCLFNAFSHIITARKRSLGQGNVFTGACHSFCPWRGGVCIWGREVCIQEGFASRGVCI